MAAAYAALASLMNTLHEIQHHPAPPISLDESQVQFLTQNVKFLQGFLESYNPPGVFDDEESADPLAMRIADAAYTVEDVIESHIVDTIQLLNNISTPNQTKLNRLFSCIRSPQKVDEQIMSLNFNQNLQQAIEGMDSIMKTAMGIDTAEKAVVVVPAASASSSTGPSSTGIAVVGFEEARLQITEKLIEDRPDRQVVPIVGMGGIGKTTLAKYVYAQKIINERFDILAWTTISQQYSTRKILLDIYSQACGKDKKNVSEDELGRELHKCLFGRRFLIVLDDMWSIDVWDNVQQFFPNNQNGSRVLVTTRLLELSSWLNSDYSHRVDFLNKASSWDLFSKTVFGEKINNSCPRKLEKIAKKIVDSCRGLPLSILVVGGLLKKMDATQRCWESIRSNLTSVVNLENDKQCLRLLRLSYDHLPVHLKPCFLTLAVFEENAEIKVSTLVKLWISEGFLEPVNGESSETSARRLLRDLVDRNLVLISKLGSTGNIKSCKIHDLVRDLCLKEGRREGFYHVIGQSSPRCINWQRRLVIPRNTSKRKVLGDLQSMPMARSVICEEDKFLQCRNLRLLRTFHAYELCYAGDRKRYTRSFALQHVNLRHFKIAGEVVTPSFLSSVGLLWNLHTMIVHIWDEDTATIPEIWKMPQLRHIEFVGNNLCLPDPPSFDDDDAIFMENLEVLKGVRDFKCGGGVVKRIPNIKKLKMLSRGIEFEDEYFYGIRNIELLCKLESLSVLVSPDFVGCPTYLHNLTFPHSLKKLSLNFFGNNEFAESMLEKMGSLPFLEKLHLSSGSFGTMDRWEVVEGQFPSLKYLSLHSCYGLQHWTATEEGSSIFPCLEQIHLSFLEELKSIPCEIGNIPTLQKISMINCNKAAVKSAKEMVDEQVELQGDNLPFRVVVKLYRFNQELQNFSGGGVEACADAPRADAPPTGELVVTVKKKRKASKKRVIFHRPTVRSHGAGSFNNWRFQYLTVGFSGFQHPPELDKS